MAGHVSAYARRATADKPLLTQLPPSPRLRRTCLRANALRQGRQAGATPRLWASFSRQIRAGSRLERNRIAAIAYCLRPRVFALSFTEFLAAVFRSSSGGVEHCGQILITAGGLLAPARPPEAPMRSYRCCLFVDLYLTSDDAARELAGDLLHRSDCTLAEVWKGSEMVFLTGRAD